MYLSPGQAAAIFFIVIIIALIGGSVLWGNLFRPY